MKKQYAIFELPVSVYDEHECSVKLTGDYSPVYAPKSEIIVEQATDIITMLVPCWVFWEADTNPVYFDGFKGQIERTMSLTAHSTHKNAYDQVLFLAGKTYEVVDEDSKRYWVLNELRTETPVRKNTVHEKF